MVDHRTAYVSGLHLIAVTVLLASAAAADSAESNWVPKHEGWINDTANVLSSPERNRLSDILSRYQQETHHQLAVLTVPTLSGESIETFSLRVANTWGLGYKGLDNGILVTLAMKERRVRIELGKGMNRYISDSTAQSIVSTSMTPAFAKGDFSGGLEAGLSRLMQEARSFVVSDPPPRRSHDS